jgi:AcrR family transcriptional regulator
MSALAVPNKHQQKSEATRRKLITAARRVFARDGFDATRIEDIAAHAGHTRGAFYANFENKESLFLALLEQQISDHLNLLMLRLRSCESDRQRITALRHYYLERVSDRQWCMLMLEFKLFAVRHPRVRAKLARAHRQIRSTVKSQLGRLLPCTFLNCSEDATRASLEATLHGLVLQHSYDPESLSRDELVSVLGHTFDMLVAANPRNG